MKYKVISIAITGAFLLLWLLVFTQTGVPLLKYVAPALPIPFTDLITITYSVDCLNAGYDPYVVTSFDPLHRLYNYPSIWLDIFDFLGLNGKVTNVLGILMILAFYTITYSFIKIRNSREMWVYTLLLLSPPVLLLLERANSDLFIYLLLLGAVQLRYTEKLPVFIRTYLPYVLLLFAFMLKLYPLFALSFLLLDKLSRKSFITLAVICAATVSLYIYTHLEEIGLISLNTPRESFLSYGKNVLLQLFFDDKMLVLVTNGLFALMICTAFLLGRKKHQEIVLAEGKERMAFILGAAVYAGTFFIGNNWDYRLCFLLLTAPFLWNALTHFIKPGFRIFLILCFMVKLFYFPAMLLLRILGGKALEKVVYLAEQFSSWAILYILLYFLSLLLLEKYETVFGNSRLQRRAIDS